ncbi:MAG: hypothetical protein R3C30_02735 [Hyphomonadaceae bacterium]
MSDSAWVLNGIDPDTRDRAVREAGRLGVSLSDYLTDMVLRAAITDQVVSSQPEEPVAPEDGAEAGVRHRFRTLERRLEHSLSGLDSAQRTLDASLFDISERVDELEGVANGTAHALQQGLQDTAEHLVALQQQAEESAAARASENAAAHEGLASSISALNAYTQDIDTIARRADANAGVLADAHETLKHAIASDFSEFADQIALRLNIGLRDVATAADEAAAQADAAVANLVVELRGVRETLEQSVADGVDETRRRVHTAFTETTQRMEALSDRVEKAERQAAVSADQLRARMADMEDAAQIALEDTAESLRQAGASLAADLQRAQQGNRAALESLHSDFSSEIAELRERQQGAVARLKLLDEAVSDGAADASALRQQLLERVAAAALSAADRASQVLSTATEQTEAVASRLARHEEQAAETHFLLRAENERIETATYASLQKLAADIAQGRSDAAELLDQVRTEVREQHSGVSARLTVIDLALRAQTSLVERISQVEAALSDAASSAKLSDMEAQVSVLRQAVGSNGDEAIVRRIDELSARLAEAADGDAALDSKVADVEAQMNVLRRAIAKSGDDSLLRRIEELRGGGDAFNARLGDIEAQLNVLRQAVSKSSEDHILQRIAELTSRIDGWDSDARAGAEKSDDLVRLMGRLSTNYADASAQADQRLHKLEVALADLRLEHLSAQETPIASAEDVSALSDRIGAVERLQSAVVTSDAMAALESRMGAVERQQASHTPDVTISGPTPEEVAQLNRRLAAMESRQAEALEAMRTDIVRFVTENDRRLATLEHTEVDYNLAAEFDALRRRVEERILGIETRSVRTLEQVADTVQMLEERFTAHDDGERQTA